MTNNQFSNKKYDLAERTKNFSISVLVLGKIIQWNNLNRNILSQLLRSATSVGANYSEANNASSKKDFKNKIALCRKEIQETKYWLELLVSVENKEKEKINICWKEAHKLTLIFNKIGSTLRESNII